MKNETIYIDAIVNLTKVIGYLERNETISAHFPIGPYDSLPIKTFPINGLGIGYITAEVYYQDTGELIGRKSVYCIMILIYQMILHFTEK